MSANLYAQFFVSTLITECSIGVLNNLELNFTMLNISIQGLWDVGAESISLEGKTEGGEAAKSPELKMVGGKFSVERCEEEPVMLRTSMTNEEEKLNEIFMLMSITAEKLEVIYKDCKKTANKINQSNESEERALRVMYTIPDYSREGYEKRFKEALGQAIPNWEEHYATLLKSYLSNEAQESEMSHYHKLTVQWVAALFEELGPVKLPFTSQPHGQ